MASSTLTVTDNRTGKRYELPIEHGAIRATDLAQIRVAPGEPGLVSYDDGMGSVQFQSNLDLLRCHSPQEVFFE